MGVLLGEPVTKGKQLSAQIPADHLNCQKKTGKSTPLPGFITDFSRVFLFFLTAIEQVFQRLTTQLAVRLKTRKDPPGCLLKSRLGQCSADKPRLAQGSECCQHQDLVQK